jgi:hypothetical protein
MIEFDPNRNWLRDIWHLAGTPAFSPLTSLTTIILYAAISETSLNC